MSSLSTATSLSQDNLFLHFHSRRFLLHIPLNQPKPEANPPATAKHHDPLDPYSGQSSFDANIIIVLSLLVCGVICSIGMNFIVKCALRCMSSTQAASGLDSECAICLSEFKSGERVRVLPKCNHGFHVRCIDRWLSQQSSCPTCRNCLIGTCQKILICSQSDLPAPIPETRETVLSITPIEPEDLGCIEPRQ